MKNIELTKAEEIIIEKSKNINITKNRIRQVVVWGILAISIFTYLFLIEKNYTAAFIIGILYIVITIIEKVLYGNAVIIYKSVISKLASRINEIDKKQEN